MDDDMNDYIGGIGRTREQVSPCLVDFSVRWTFVGRVISKGAIKLPSLVVIIKNVKDRS